MVWECPNAVCPGSSKKAGHGPISISFCLQRNSWGLLTAASWTIEICLTLALFSERRDDDYVRSLLMCYTSCLNIYDRCQAAAYLFRPSFTSALYWSHLIKILSSHGNGMFEVVLFSWSIWLYWALTSIFIWSTNAEFLSGACKSVQVP